MADVKLVTKFVDLGSTGGYGFALYGFRNIGGSYGSFGTLSETANGSSNTTTSYLYSTTTDIKEIYWADQSTDTLYFTLAGNRANSVFIWSKLKIGSTTFTRSTASYSYNSSTDRTTWSWTTSTNPFGSTTNGTDVAIEVILEVNTGHTASVSATTISAASTSDVTYTLSNASLSQKYRLVKSSGTIASGGANGTLIDSRNGSGTLTIDYSNNELPPANNNATYQLQVAGGYVSASETESGFWINTTGQNNSFTITREAAPPATGSFNLSTSTITEGGSLTVQNISTSPSGGYHLKLFRNSGDSPDSISPTTKTWTGTSTANFTMSVGNQSASEIGYQGESFTWLLREGTDTSAGWNSGASLDSADFTLYDDEHGTSVSSSSISIGAAATSFTVGVISNWSGTSTVAARIRNTTTDTVVKTFNITTNNGTTNVSVTSGLPAQGGSSNYRVEVYNGNAYLNGATFSVSKAAPSYSVTAPASINEGASGTINISTVGIADGTTLYWSVSTGDTPVDFDSPASGSVTISSNAASFTVTPTADATTEGAETATVRIRTGSQAGTIVATDTFTINDTSQYPVPTTPTDISFAADPGTASSTVSIACTASGGANGTLQVSEDNTNWYTNGTSFTFTRGTAKTIYARRTGAGGTSSSYSESHTVGYLQPDLAVAATSSTITFNATSATTTVSGGQAAETYAVRVNNGSTNLGTRTGNGNITFTSSLPSVGNTTTYEIFARRPVSTGGDGSTYYQTNDTFTVTRSVESVTAPTDIVFGTSSAASPTVSITATASGGSGGTLQVSENNSTWVANGSSFTFTRGTAKTIYARRTGSGSTSSSYSESHTVGYLQPDLAVAATSSTIAFTATSASTTVSGGQSAETYAVRVNNGATNLGTRTGNGAISFTSSLPSGGNTTTYEIFARRPTSTGGDGSTYYQTNDTFTVTRTAQDSTPNAFTFTDATGVALSTTQTSNQITITGITGSVSVSVSGGTYSKNGGSYTSAAGTASVNDTFRVQHTSSSSYETAVNTTLTVGTVSDTFTTTTLASGSGGGGNIGGGTSNYGIEVYDTNGTTKVLSPSTRYLNALSDVTTYTFAASGNSGSTYDIVLDMTDLTTSNSDVYFITGDIVITTSRLSDRFRLTNVGQSSVTASFVAIRF